LSIAGHYFLPSFGVRIPCRKNWSSFEAIHESIQFFTFIRPEVLVSQAVCHWSKQVIVREQHLENTASGVGLPISTFPSMSWPLSQHEVEHCHAAKTLSCLSLYCSRLSFNAQKHQLRSIPIACDCFSRF